MTERKGTDAPEETRHYIGLTPEGWRVSLKGEGWFTIPAGEPLPFGAAVLYQVSDEIRRTAAPNSVSHSSTGSMVPLLAYRPSSGQVR